MPSIGHPDYPISAHLTVKHGKIIEFGLLSTTGTSCNPERGRLLPNLVRLIRSPTRQQEYYMVVVWARPLSASLQLSDRLSPACSKRRSTQRLT
jgi:hypothetical protein